MYSYSVPRMPINQEPICGWKWFRKHQNDHSQAEVDSLGIELRVAGKVLARVRAGQRAARGVVTSIMELNK